MDKFTLHHGDCLEVMTTLPDNSVEAVVTDPPYELGFMGKAWDSSGIAYNADVWRECLRILKPGGYLLAFGGSRTYHRLAVAIEDAGFEIRDQIQWIYGSGFPKSLDVSKAIDKMKGAEREIISSGAAVKRMIPGADQDKTGEWIKDNGRKFVPTITAPASDEAKQWKGFGTALKPAFEPLVVARKPAINTGEFDIMVREVITNLCQSKPLVEIAVKGFQLSRPEQNAELNIAQWIAEKSINTPGVLSDLMDILQSEWATNTNLSIALLWLNTLAVICSRMNTYTTETKSSLIIELKILNSLPLPLILEHIIKGATLPDGDDTNVYTAANIFNAVFSKLNYIHEHFVVETAISKGRRDCPDADEKVLNEPIVMARKPLSEKTVAENVLKWGTGAINIDGCRIGVDPNDTNIRDYSKHERTTGSIWENAKGADKNLGDKGRFPANIIRDGSDEVEAAFAEFGEKKSGNGGDSIKAGGQGNAFGHFNGGIPVETIGDSGSVSRFFYAAKASGDDRPDWNNHPTVKPVALMRYLCRLVTPPSGIVLDPFTGSGSTGVGAAIEGFGFIGIEKEGDSLEIAEARISRANLVPIDPPVSKRKDAPTPLFD